jgi:hypothetical protein
MNSIERAAQVVAKHRERRAYDERLRQLRSTPAGRAILAYENGQTHLTLTLAIDVADFAVYAIQELVLPPDAHHPDGSRWTLKQVAAAATEAATRVPHATPDGIGESWSRVTPTGWARDIYTFERVPLDSIRGPKASPVGTGG